MLKTVLVGINGSPSCRAATATAMAWAKQHDAQVVGLAVVDPAATASDEFSLASSPAPDVPIASVEALRAETLLYEFEWSCLSAGLTPTRVQETGESGNILARHSQSADLLFVGLSRRIGTPIMSPLSATLDKVVTNAIHPVVCVPSMVTPGDAILVAYDGSIQAARTLFAFVGLELFPKQTIHLVAVGEEPNQHEAALLLADKYLMARGYQTHTRQLAVQSGGVAATLIHEISAVRPKLVVCGVFGKSWLRPVLCGSVTKALLHEVSVPIFLYH